MSTPASPTSSRIRHIQIKNARTHNLKNLDLVIPHNQLIVITGPSGSGKSSLAFNTLFAEGQRRYMESLSAYARQFLAKIPKPPIDYIKGILPSIGMPQKASAHNQRARVGTSTDLYAYLKLLYARIGQTYSPVSGQIVKKHTVQDVIHYIHSQPQNAKIFIMAPLVIPQSRPLKETLQIELRKGFTRLMHQDTISRIEDLIENPNPNLTPTNTHLIIDRLVLNTHQDQELTMRLSDSIQAAFFEGQGTCIVQVLSPQKKTQSFSDRFEADGMKFLEPSTHFFNFNNPYGACQDCGGLGKRTDIDPEKVVPNPNLSLAQGAILPWQSPSMQPWQNALIDKSHLFNLPIHTPYKDLTQEQKNIIWKGNSFFKGIETFFKFIDKQTYKIQYRVMQARYRGTTQCNSCRGTGLRKETNDVKIGGKNLIDLLCMPIAELNTFFAQLILTPHQRKVSHIIREEIKKRLNYLTQVGLTYLTLDRRTNTLSGGEYQRIRLARALGSALVDILYILDEPTVGLHPKDTEALIQVLLSLKKMGNTLIVVEHEEALMQVADQLIDIGPEAGFQGGKLVFQGSPKSLSKAKNSYTADYFTGKKTIPLPPKNKTWTRAIHLKGAYAHNLKNVDVDIPIGIMTAVTGVSGSGKSTLIQEILYPALSRALNLPTSDQIKLENISGAINHIQAIAQVNQHTAGLSSRSNPATYTKVYDTIRKIFAMQNLAVERNYTPGFFSFNTPGGRCEVCKGSGDLKVEMQFLADVVMPCESCHGKRFKTQILEVYFQGKNIHEVLEMTITQSLTFFQDFPPVVNSLKALENVGLGYLKLGQPSSTFSGGEAQRLKLASHLSLDTYPTKPTLFIFDEPTTGLHFRDVAQLIYALQQLVAQGHTVIVIEHNLDLIKCADWIIDIGPGAGKQGGNVIFAGTPQQLIQLQKNITAHYLRPKFTATSSLY